MKTFTLLFLIFCFSFFTKTNAQTFSYNMHLEDFDIEFPLSNTDLVDRSQSVWIFFYNSFGGYPAELDNGKIVLSHPSELWFTSGELYTCYAGYIDIFGEIKYTKNFTFKAPVTNVILNWKIENDILKTVAEVDDIYCLTIDKINTRFNLFNHTGSIGEDFHTITEWFFPEDYSVVTEKNFKGEYLLFQSNQDFNFRKGLSFGIELLDYRGQKRLQAYTYTVVGFVDELKLSNNLVDIGAITPYWLDSESREARIFDTSGNLVAKFLAKSGEAFWPSSYFTATGIYFLQIDNIGTAKFAKAN